MRNLKVIEVFGPTIQGEGPFVGRRSIFIRFANCDFKCALCDTPDAVLPHLVKQHALSVDPEQLARKVLSECLKHNVSLVVLTGGNPALQDDAGMFSLINTLQEHFISVQVETQGTICPDWFVQASLIVACPKGPSFRLPNKRVKNVERNSEGYTQQSVSDFAQFYADCSAITDTTVKFVLFPQALTFEGDVEFMLACIEHARIRGYVHISLGNSWIGYSDETRRLPYDYSLLHQRLESLFRESPRAKKLVGNRAVILPQLHKFCFSNGEEHLRIDISDCVDPEPD